MYDDQIATIYRVQNGFVVECREKKPEEKAKKDSSCCIGPRYETKTYTASNAAAVMKIIKEKMASPADRADTEYKEAFKEAASK